MDIYFKSKKLQKVCSESKTMIKALGHDRAKRLKQRMMELKAAVNLAEISHLPPPRLHMLNGDMDGHFTVDISHSYRLMFLPVGDVVHMVDGGIDRSSVTSIEIVAIIDPH